jgi:chemotaxis regulatin CheY-phosphate phosphatase CheZ
MSVVGSAIAVTRLDKEVRRVTTTYPEEDPITLADHMVRMCEEEVLDWMRTRTVHPGPDADPDPKGSTTGQELVDDLERVLAEEEAGRYPPPG